MLISYVAHQVFSFHFLIGRLLLTRDVQKLDDETWSRVGSLLADLAFHDGDAHFAVDMIVLVVGALNLSSNSKLSTHLPFYLL